MRRSLPIALVTTTAGLMACGALVGLGDRPSERVESGLDASDILDATDVKDTPDALKVIDEGSRLPGSCLELSNSYSPLGHATSGIYTLDVDGVLLDAYCDMATGGGGWTVFYVTTLGASHVVGHFDMEAADHCPDPQRECIRAVPNSLYIGTTMAAVCGDDAISFDLSSDLFTYFRGSAQTGWLALTNLSAIAGEPNLSSCEILLRRLWRRPLVGVPGQNRLDHLLRRLRCRADRGHLRKLVQLPPQRLGFLQRERLQRRWSVRIHAARCTDVSLTAAMGGVVRDSPAPPVSDTEPAAGPAESTDGLGPTERASISNERTRNAAVGDRPSARPWSRLHASRAGTTLGQYEILGVIGTGGMGAVYEARHRTLGRRVAMKLLHEGDAALPDGDVRTARFLREGRAAAQVTHPHVVDVFDFGVEDGVPFLVMEFVEGETLAQRIAREGALPLNVTIELMLPVLSAVAELHAAGVIHRDLKPANILLTHERGGELCPKVGDFGVSRVNDGTAAVTESNAVVGTFAYMSPEQARSARETTERSDQYSLGVILYECATGVRPHDASAPFELLHAILYGTFEPPSARNPSLPPELDAIVARAMARDPAARFATLQDFGEALLALAAPEMAARWDEEFRGPRSPGAVSVRAPSFAPPPPVLSEAPRTRRASRLAVGGALALTVIAALGAWLVLARPRGVTPEKLPLTRATATSPDPTLRTPAPEPADTHEASAPLPAPPSAALSTTAPPPAPRTSHPSAVTSAAHPAASARHATPTPAMGENGAPILDP